MKNTDFLLLQINDSLFPIGAYAHSYGLETYILRGLIKNGRQTQRYIESYIKNSMVSAELLSIKIAFEKACQEDIEGILCLEELASASRLPEEIRDANKKLGSRFIKTVISSNEDLRNNIFINYINAEGTKTHAVAYGVFCASMQMDLKSVLKHFLYSQISALVTNCVKCVPLSQTEGQKILVNLFDTMNIAIKLTYELNETDLYRSCPAFDIRSMQHQVLYSRIFMS
ncbi:MAG TPA: urease accessory protein UreF [Lachnospiraceae bacterium]|nr:urease accessory protein UreF [Lachnospiraceae bacterium]